MGEGLTEKSPNTRKKIHPGQRSPRMPNKMSPKKTTPGHIFFKRLRTHIHTVNSSTTKEAGLYGREKTLSSTSGSGKTGQVHVRQ